MIDWFWAFIEALRYYPTTVDRDWWKKRPYLPLPPGKFIKFRLDTAYGMVEHGWPRPPFRDIIKDVKRFLVWRRKHRQLTKWSRKLRPDPSLNTLVERRKS